MINVASSRLRPNSGYVKLPRVKEGKEKRWVRPTIAGILALACTFIMLFAQRSTPAVQSQDNAAETLRLINQFRAELGLAPFQYNPQLAQAAQQQANWLIANGNTYVHTWPDGTTKDDRARAAGFSGRVIENIVGGRRMSPRQALIWWQNSPVHYQTLVTTRYSQAGTAFAFGEDSHRYVLVVGQVGTASQPVGPSAPDPDPLIIEPVTLAEEQEDGSIVHVLGLGQAIWTLAAYYDVEVADILFYNELDETAFVSPGDQIIIKPADDWVPPPTPTPSFTHVVQEGQTLWTIAAIHQISLGDLLLYNGFANEEAFISAGQEIVVRLRPGEAPPPTPTPPTTYIVQAGDSLYGIAGFNGVPFDSLLQWNNLEESSLLTPGMELRIVPPLSEVEAVIQSLTPESNAAEGALLPEETATPAAIATATLTNLTLVEVGTLEPTPTAVEVAVAPNEPLQSDESFVLESAEASEDSLVNVNSGSSASRDPFLFLGMGIATILGIIFLILGGYFVWQGNK